MVLSKYFNQFFLTGIGILKHFGIWRSVKIVKIGKGILERHLANFLQCMGFNCVANEHEGRDQKSVFRGELC